MSTGSELSPKGDIKEKQNLSGGYLEDCKLVFSEGKQKGLFAWFLKKNHLSQNALGGIIGTSRRNVRSYRDGRLLIKKSTFNRLVAFDADAKRFEEFIVKELPLHWGQSIGGKNGMAGLWKKYGVEQIRKWRKDEYTRRTPPLNIPKEIKLPVEINPEIAELLGAYLGDGTLTEYFIRISGDKRFDKNYFAHLSGLAERNFGVKGTISETPSTNQLALVFFSKNLATYFMEKFELKIGDKIRNQSKIPQFVLDDDALAKSCLRGLMDTDGSVSRRSTYMCLAFTAYCPVLLNQVYDLGMKFGYFSYKVEGQVGSNSWKKIQKYFAEVGSSNLRHIIRFEERLKNKKFLYQAETLNYYAKYENVAMPYLLAN